MGKPCKLSDARAESLMRDYWLGQQLKPQRLARKYGVSLTSVYEYAHRRHKIGPARRARR